MSTRSAPALALFAACVGFVLSLLAPAVAQTPPSDSAETGVNSDDPAALFARGKELYGEGRYQESYRAYLRAFELQPSFDVAGNLGNVEIELGKHGAAVEHLDYALSNLPLSLDADRRKEVVAKIRARRSEALTHVATVRIVTVPAGAEVLVGDANKGTAPLAPLYLDPGKHEISASLAGHAAVSQTLDAEPGSNHQLTLTLAPDNADADSPTPATAAPAEQPDEPDDVGGPNVALVVAGSALAAAGVAVGVALLVVSEGKLSDAETMVSELGGNSSCSSPLAPAERCDEIDSLANDGILFRGGGIAALVVGGVALAGTLTYALWPRDDEASSSIAPLIVPLVAAPGSPHGLLPSGALLTIEVTP